LLYRLSYGTPFRTANIYLKLDYPNTLVKKNRNNLK
jgi:hypothetical protein